MKHKQPKPRATFAQALAKTDLTTLMTLYEQLYRAHDSFYYVPDYEPALDVAVQNQVAWPLERALNSCADALKRAKTKDGHETELRAALLYNHALRFDADNNKARRAILCEALLAIPSTTKTKVERVGNLEVRTHKQGNKIIWRDYIELPKKPSQKAAKA